MRLVLIEDTINFEQKYHCGRIARQRIDPEPSRLWYLQTGDLDDASSTVRLNIFIHALLNMVLYPFNNDTFPETFSLDSDRLRSLRSDISDLFCLDACEKVFVDLALAAGLSRTHLHEARESLRSDLSSIITLSPYGSTWDDNLENVTLEVVRHLFLLARDDDRDLDTTREHQLRDTADEALRTIFSDPKRSFFWARGEQVKEEVTPAILANVERFINVSPVDIFNAFISPCGDASLRQKQFLGKLAPDSLSVGNVLADVVRRVSHIAVLHWRIWAPIVYLYEPDPVAQAVDMVRSGSSLRDSPAPAQRLSSNNEGSWSESEDGGEKEAQIGAHGVSSPPAAANESDVMVTGTHTDAAVLGEEPSSPVLYRQPTNG